MLKKNLTIKNGNDSHYHIKMDMSHGLAIDVDFSSIAVIIVYIHVNNKYQMYIVNYFILYNNMLCICVKLVC
jgi:hypothetical protein